MKKFRLLLFFLISIGFSACIASLDELEPFSTDLRVYVKDSASQQPVEGATVLLFRSRLDFETRNSAIASGITDQEGQIEFKNLESANHYVYAAYEKNGQYFDNSQADFNMVQETVQNALTIIGITVRYRRPAQPTKMELEELWLMKYQKDLYDSLRWLSVKMIDQNQQLIDVSNLYFYYGQYYVDIENAVSLRKKKLSFELDKNPVLVFHIDEINRTKNLLDTQTAVLGDYVNFMDFTKANPKAHVLAYPERIRVVQDFFPDTVFVDLLVRWK